MKGASLAAADYRPRTARDQALARRGDAAGGEWKRACAGAALRAGGERRQQWGLTSPPAPTVHSRKEPGLGGEAIREGFFEQSPGAGARNSPPGSFRRLAAPSGSSRGLPVGAEAPNGSPLDRSEEPFGSGPAVRDAFEPKLSGSAAGRFPRPKPRVCLAAFEPGLRRPPCSQLPFPRGSGPARRVPESRNFPFPAGGGAPTCVPLSAGQAPDLRPLPACLVAVPRRARKPGHFTKPAATASAEGQARNIRYGGGFVSRPGLRSVELLRPEGLGKPAFARAVAGKAFDRCRSIVSATAHCCHIESIRPSGIRLWITRITGRSAPAAIPGGGAARRVAAAPQARARLACDPRRGSVPKTRDGRDRSERPAGKERGADA